MQLNIVTMLLVNVTQTQTGQKNMASCLNFTFTVWFWWPDRGGNSEEPWNLKHFFFFLWFGRWRADRFLLLFHLCSESCKLWFHCRLVDHWLRNLLLNKKKKQFKLTRCLLSGECRMQHWNKYLYIHWFFL